MVIRGISSLSLQFGINQLDKKISLVQSANSYPAFRNETLPNDVFEKQNIQNPINQEPETNIQQEVQLQETLEAAQEPVQETVQETLQPEEQLAEGQEDTLNQQTTEEKQ